ncbi:MAG: hypothetical protein AB7K09_13365 [Planctomycetota bacterium]
MWDVLHPDWHKRPLNVDLPEFSLPAEMHFFVGAYESLIAVALPLEGDSTADVARRLFSDLVDGASARAVPAGGQRRFLQTEFAGYPHVVEIRYYMSYSPGHEGPPWGWCPSHGDPVKRQDLWDRHKAHFRHAFIEPWWNRVCCALAFKDVFTAEIELGEPPPPWPGDDPPHLQRVAQWEAMSDADRQAAIDARAAARAADAITLRSGRVIGRAGGL